MSKYELESSVDGVCATAEIQLLPGAVSEKPSLMRPNDADIATLAYQLWQERGCPNGEADQDWYEAERSLKVGNDRASDQ